MTKITSIDEIVVAIVAAMKAAVLYTVTDGPPSRLPKDSKFLAVGAESLDDQSEPTTTALADQEYSGLGEVARTEQVQINCVAVGRARAIKDARSLAMSVVTDVGTYMPKKPTPETWNALIGNVNAVRSHNLPGGSIVQIQFTITTTARLV
jgi:hypothetical protein